MNKKMICLVMGILILFGCSHVRHADHIEKRDLYIQRINHFGLHQPADIHLVNGDTIISAQRIHIQSDSVSFFWGDSQDQKILPMNQLKKIIFTHHFKGAFEGFCTGSFLGFFGSGILTGVSLSLNPGCDPAGSGMAVLAGISIGAFIGTFIGTIKGSDEVFQF